MKKFTEIVAEAIDGRKIRIGGRKYELKADKKDTFKIFADGKDTGFVVRKAKTGRKDDFWVYMYPDNWKGSGTISFGKGGISHKMYNSPEYAFNQVVIHEL